MPPAKSLPVTRARVSYGDICGAMERVSYFPALSGHKVEFMLDASGCYGCGAWSGTEWWQFKWHVIVIVSVYMLCFIVTIYIWCATIIES